MKIAPANVAVAVGRSSAGDLSEALRAVSQNCRDETTAHLQFRQCAESVSGVMAATVVSETAPSPPSTPQAELVFDGEDNNSAILSISRQAAIEGRRITTDHPHVRNVTLVAIPVASKSTTQSLVVALVDSPKGDVSAISQLESIAFAMAAWISRKSERWAEVRLTVTAAAIELTQQLEQCSSVQEASAKLVSEMESFTGCPFVAVGLCRHPNGRCVTESIYGSTQLNRNSVFVRQLNEVLSETVARREPTLVRKSSPGSVHAALAHEAFLTGSDYQCVTSIPLTGLNQKVCGVLVVAGAGKQVAAPHCEGLLKAAGPLIGCTFDLLRDASASPARAASAAKRWFKPLTVLAGLMVIMAATMCFPVAHRIVCECTVEPVSKRICVSPYDGIISTAFAETGSEVCAGEVLAEMESREIRWELASLQARAAQSIKQRDTEMIAGNMLESQLADLELGQIQARNTMLRARLENKLIVAPISGVVLTGTMENMTNAAVRIGTPIYEIAPLDSMLVEVAVPESEVDYLNAGQSATITFHGGNRMQREGKIREVYPQAEIRGGQNVFVAILELDNSDRRLRPGTNGIARVSAGTASVGWILFHRAYERVCMWWPL